MEENISAAQVSVYPNPVKDEINFDLSFNSRNTISIEIFDVLGMNVASAKDINGTGPKHITIPLLNKSAGVYFYRITTGDKQVVNGKVMKM
jgi:hypothetical protein